MFLIILRCEKQILDKDGWNICVNITKVAFETKVLGKDLWFRIRTGLLGSLLENFQLKSSMDTAQNNVRDVFISQTGLKRELFG